MDDLRLQTLAAAFADQGARAVALLGSRARGDSHDFSDWDVVVIGAGESTSRLVDGALVSICWTSEADVRAGWSSPELAGMNIPGWRTALPCWDPDGIVARLTREARAWTWQEVAIDADAWVAEQFTGYAEEVMRLAGHLHGNRDIPAAVVRDILALRIPKVLAVDLQLLYATENRLWIEVAREMGPAWLSEQRAAFALDGQAIALSGRAALKLYDLAAHKLCRLLTQEQLAVVENARLAIDSLRDSAVGSSGS